MNSFDDLYNNGLNGWGFWFRESQLYRYRKYISLLVNNKLNENNNFEILEIACWDGFFTGNYLYPVFKHITGVDISQEAIERARVRYSNINFIVDSIPDLNNINKKFHLITLNECLYYLSDFEQKQTITRVHELLGSDGYLMISVNIGGKPYFRKQDIDDLIKEKFVIIDNDDICIKHYYKYVECMIWRLIEVTQNGFWEKHKATKSRLGKYAKIIFDNKFMKNYVNPVINRISKFILFKMPIRFIDKLSRSFCYDSNLSVYIILCKKI